MYEKACKVVVLRNKRVAFLKSCLPSPSSLLELPTVGGGEGRGKGVGFLYLTLFSVVGFRSTIFYDIQVSAPL